MNSFEAEFRKLYRDGLRAKNLEAFPLGALVVDPSGGPMHAPKPGVGLWPVGMVVEVTWEGIGVVWISPFYPHKSEFADNDDLYGPYVSDYDSTLDCPFFARVHALPAPSSQEEPCE